MAINITELTKAVAAFESVAAGMRVLITGGPTCEDIDPVRFLTNRSTGRMGVELALAAQALEMCPLLILGPTALAVPADLPCVRVRSAADMLQAVEAAFASCDALIMSAAVADYTPAEPLTHKLKKGEGELCLRLTRTADILHTLAQHPHRAGKKICGFSLDKEINLEEGRRKLAAKNLDMIAVNGASAFGSDTSAVTLLLHDGHRVDLPGQSKADTARALLQMLRDLSPQADAGSP